VFITGIDIVFCRKPGHGHIKLQNPDCADDLHIPDQGHKYLDGALLCQLGQSLVQGLGLEGIF